MALDLIAILGISAIMVGVSVLMTMVIFTLSSKKDV